MYFRVVGRRRRQEEERYPPEDRDNVGSQEKEYGRSSCFFAKFGRSTCKEATHE